MKTQRIGFNGVVTRFMAAAAAWVLGAATANAAVALSGAGTEASPYLITSAADMATLRDWVNAGNTCASEYFSQTADIAISAWPGIGTSETVSFQGVYDGGNTTISAQFDSGKYRGVFAYAKNATIKNLKVNVTGRTGIVAETGGAAFVGQSYGSTLQNLTATCDAGAMGTAETPLTHNGAGIVVRMNGGTCYGCTNKMDIYSSYTKVGGIAAFGQSTDTDYFELCSNEGTLYRSYTGTGDGGCAGIIGWQGYSNYQPVSIKDCSSTGAITASKTIDTGSFIGYKSEGGLTVSGINVGLADLRPVGTGGHNTPLLWFATIDTSVTPNTATFNGYALNASNKVMEANSAAITLANEGDYIILDTSLASYAGTVSRSDAGSVTTTVLSGTVTRYEWALPTFTVNVAAGAGVENLQYKLGAAGEWTAYTAALANVAKGTVLVVKGTTSAAGYEVKDATVTVVADYPSETPLTINKSLIQYFPTAGTTGAYPGQDGSASNPFVLATADDYVALKNAVANGTAGTYCYRQVADITLGSAETPWAGIGLNHVQNGWNETGTYGFSGTLDGGNYTVNVYMGGGRYHGLFNNAVDAVISNLTVNVTGWAASAVADDGGALCGICTRSTLQNIKTTASGTISTDGNLGGVASLSRASPLIACTNEIDLTTTFWHVGGIVSYTDGLVATTIRNCMNEGALTSDRPSGYVGGGNPVSIGGILGWANGAATIDSCVNTGTLTTGANWGVPASTKFGYGSILGTWDQRVTTVTGVNVGRDNVAGCLHDVATLQWALPDTPSAGLVTFCTPATAVAGTVTYKVMHGNAKAFTLTDASASLTIITNFAAYTGMVSLDASLLADDYELVIGGDADKVVYTAAIPTPALTGNGTEASPYLITSLADLVNFRDWVNDGNNCSGEYYRVTADIDMSSESNWTPISDYGYGAGANLRFAGTFDGGNFTISHLTITSNTTDLLGNTSDLMLGLFGAVGSAHFRNIRLSDVDIGVTNATGDATNTGICAALVANASGASTIRNVEIVSGSVKSTENAAGIYAFGTAYLHLSNCVNRAAVTGYCSGGIAGVAGRDVANPSLIEFCINYGAIASLDNSGSGVGGILGKTQNNLVRNCTNHGAVNARNTNTYAGGICGVANGGSVFENCVNFGNVASDVGQYGRAGGIVGSTGNAIPFTRCINLGDVTGYQGAGGIVFNIDAYAGPLSYCYNAGAIQATHGNAGGLAGGLTGQATTYSLNDGSVTASGTVCMTSPTTGASVYYHAAGVLYKVDGTPAGITETAACNALNTGLAAGSEFWGVSPASGQVAPDFVNIYGTPGVVWVDDGYAAGNSGGHIWGYDAFANLRDGVYAVGDGGTVNIAAGTYPEIVFVDKSLDIVGAGAATTIVDGGAADSVIFVDGDIDVSIEGLTIQNGSAADGGGIYVQAGVGMDATLAVYDCVLTNNVATGNGGAIANLGLYEAIVLDGCTFSDNTAASGKGGAVYILDADLAMANCTVSGNTAKNGGGCYFDGVDANIDLDHITVTLNTAIGSPASKGGGLLLNAVNGKVANSIICGNTDQLSGTATDNINGTIPSGSNNLRDQDAMLAALADNGGPTPTHKLLAGSPAINNAAASAVTVDQRGVPRAQGNAPDIGAYETVYIAYVDDDYTSASCGGHVWGQDAFTSVQAAINAVAVSGTVNVAAGTYAGSTVAKSVTLRGANAGIAGYATRGEESVISNSQITVSFTTAASAVAVDGFKFAGTGYTMKSGILPAETSVTFRNNLVDAKTIGDDAIQIYSENKCGDVTFTGNKFADIGLNALVISSVRSLTVVDNEFTRMAFNAVQLTGADSINITSNRIDTTVKEAIKLGGPIGGGVCSFNTILNANTSQDSDRGGIRIRGVTMPYEVTIANNTISNSFNGVAVKDGDNLAGATILVKENCLAGNSNAGIYNGGTGTLNAENNWFGSATGPMSALNSGATGDAIKGTGAVDFSPWLGDGTDTQPAVAGFQPTVSTLVYIPAKLVFATSPGGAALGARLTPQPVVEVRDEFGNPTPWATHAVTLAIGANPYGGGVLAGTISLAASAGVVPFADVAITVEGGDGYTLVASAPNLEPATSAPFVVDNPLPILQSLSPIFKTVNSGDFTLTLDGQNFVPNSKVMWGTVEKTPATFSANRLTLLISNADIATAGPVSMTVVSPLPTGGTSAAQIFTVTATALAPVVWVDDDWNGYGDCGGHVWGYDAFKTVQGGLDNVAEGGTVNVLAGTYAGALLVNKAVSVLGPNAVVNPNTGVRGAEAVLRGTTSSGLSEAVLLDAQSAVIKGFTLDNLRVDSYNGSAKDQVDGIVIDNNIFVNVLGTAIYLRDGRDAPGQYSSGISVQNNAIQSPASAGTVDFNAGSGMVIMGAEASTISGNVILNAAYNGIQLGRCKDVTVSGNTATGASQPALQIAQWNDGNITVSGNLFSTLSTTKAAVRLYGFANEYFPVFTFTGNTIKDSAYGVQIGREDTGLNDIVNADYSFSGNTFDNIGTYRLTVYLSAVASPAEQAEMDALFAQAYAMGSTAKAITAATPFTYIAVPNPVWVDDGYTSGACGGHIWGYDAFTTIQAGVNAVLDSGTVHVAAGTYAENVTAGKSVDLRGPNYGTSPNGGDRVAEAIIVPTVTNATAVVTVTASHVAIDGFTIDGDNTALPDSGVGLGGEYGTSIDAAQGVYANSNGLTEVAIRNNIVQNYSYAGIFLQQVNNYFATSTDATFSYNNAVADNRVANVMNIGVLLNSSFYAAVKDNVISNALTGLYLNSMRTENMGGAAYRVISGNSIQARKMSMRFNLFSGTPYVVSNNTLTAYADSTQAKWHGIVLATVSGMQNSMSQINLPKVLEPEFFSFADNTINGSGTDAATVGHGYWLFYVDNFRDNLGVDHFTTISGGSVSNVDVGVLLSNTDAVWGKTTCGAHASILGTSISVKSGGKGLYLQDNPSWTTGNMAPLTAKRDVILTIGAGVSVTGGAQGLFIEQPFASVQGSVSDMAFSAQTGDYIRLVANTNNINATAATFDGLTGTSANTAQNFAIENKITHKVDDVALGFVRAATVAIYVPVNSGTIDNAIAAASDGDVIYVENGVPLVLTAAITKSITFSGTFAITAANIPNDATATTVLSSFISRCGTSTVSVNVGGMNDAQIAAVNANLTGFASVTGNPVTIVRNGTTVGYAPTIQSGVNFASAGDVVNVAAGTYAERVVVNKANLTVQGAGADSIVTGTTAAPGSGVTPSVFKVAANGVTVKGFKILVDFAFNHSAVHTSGTCSGLTVSDNTVIASVTGTAAYGYGLRNAIAVNAAVTVTGYTQNNAGYAGVSVTGNTIEGTGGTVFFRSGIQMDLCAGTISGNTITSVNHDFISRFANQGDILVSGNTFLGGGAQVGSFNPGAGTVTITNNVFDGSIMQPETGALGTGAALRLIYFAEVGSVDNAVVVSRNTFQNHRWGVSVENFKNVTFDGNSFTPKANATDFVHVSFNTKIIASTEPATLNRFALGGTLLNNVFNGSGTAGGTALAFYNHHSEGALFGTFMLGSAGAENTFQSGISRFVALDNSVGASSGWTLFGGYGTTPVTTMAPWAGNLDAQNNLFAVEGGLKLPVAMSSAELFAVEDKITHKLDTAALGLVRVKASNVYVTLSSGTIQRGIDAATVGDTVNVAAGTFTENLALNKRVMLDGQGSGSDTASNTIVVAALANVPVIKVTAAGSSATDRLMIKDLRATGASPSGNNGSGVYLAAAGSHYTLDNVASVGNGGYGVVINLGGGVVGDLLLTDCTISDNTGAGFKLASVGSIDGLVIRGSHFDRNSFGFYNERGGTTSFMRGVRVTDSTFEGNILTTANTGRGFQVEKLTDAIFTRVSFSGNQNHGVLFNLKDGNFADISFTDCVFNGNTGAGTAGLSMMARNDGSYEANPAFLTNVDITGCVATGNSTGISLGNNITDMTVIETFLAGNASAGLINWTDSGIVLAENNWWGDATGPANAFNPGGIGAVVYGNTDFSPWLGTGTEDPVTGGNIGFQPVLTPVYYKPATLVFTPQPGGAAMGAALNPLPSVTVLDEIGQVATQFVGNVSLSISVNPGYGQLAGTTNMSATAGVANFSNVAIANDGGAGFKLTATVGALTVESGAFTVTSPNPALSSMNPIFIAKGSEAFTLTVRGSAFVPSSAVLWNGTPRATTYVSANQLTATIPATDRAVVGTAQISVASPAATVSGTLTFTITETALSPVVYVDGTWTGPANCGIGHVWGYDAFATIQTALDGVADQGTVNLSDGTYAETASTSKRVKLIGAKDVNGAPLPTVVGQISINNNGPIPDNCQIENIRFVVSTLNPVVLTGVNGIAVRNCSFDGIGKFLYSSGGRIGISLTSGTSNGNTDVLIEDCVFANGLFCAVQGYATGLTVKDCSIADVLTGINLQGGSNLSVLDSDVRVVAQAAVEDTYCVRFAPATGGPANDMTLAGCVLELNKNGLTPSSLKYHSAIIIRAAAAGVLAVNNCSISGDVVNQSAAAINASGNWWGSIDTAVVKTAANGGTLVDYSPWLAVGTDTDNNAVGFKGDFSTLNVGAASPQAGTVGGIQEGVNLATAGGTVNVLSGTYAEHVAIAKAVSVLGADKATTFIDGSGEGVVVLLSTNNVTLKGFTVRNSGTDLNQHAGIAAVGTTAALTGLLIEDNIVTNNATGVALLGASATVQNNEIVNNARYGIVMSSSPVNAALLSTGNTVVGNTLRGNARDGIYCDAACSGNLIAENWIGGATGTHEEGQVTALEGNGIYLWNSSNNVVRCNEIVGNEVYGIELMMSDGNTITNNVVTNNSAGICVRYGNSEQPFAGNAVHFNDVSGNTEFGIALNFKADFQKNKADYALNAENNWFGHLTGPAHLSNPGGTGKAVADYVDFSPWLGDGTDTQPTMVGFQPKLTPMYYLPVGITFSTEPADALLGATLGTVTVQVTNEIGAVATQFNGSIALAIGNNPGAPVAGELSGTTNLVVANGVAIFDGLSIVKGTGDGYTLVASTEGLPAVTSAAFDIANSTPVLTDVADWTTDEQSAPSTFTAQAYDTEADRVAQTLTFSLECTSEETMPEGITFDTATGAFSWQTVESQGGKSYTFELTVTDDGTGQKSASDTFTVTVNEVNVAPILSIADTTLEVGEQPAQPLTFTATATDQDLPAQTLTFSLVAVDDQNYPTGATLVTADAGDGTASGAFSWAPTEAQGGSNYVVDVVVTDNGTPAALTATQRVTIAVAEVNVAPELAGIPPQSAVFGQTLTFTASATDQDLPVQTLTYTMAGAPDGAELDSSSGVFTWTPTEAQAQNNYSITVTVTDNGDPALSATTNVVIGAIAAEQACAGFRSPSENMVVSNRLVFGGALTSLSWTPVLPAGWMANEVDTLGNGTAAVDVNGSIIYSEMPATSPAVFKYTVSVPGNAAVSNSVGAVVRFNGLVADVAPIAVYRYHSADYRRDVSGDTAGQFRKIDSTEINRVLSYWRFGYKPDAAGYDGFSAAAGYAGTEAAHHSADTDKNWIVDGSELLRVQMYWRGGGYLVNLDTPDGYATDPYRTGSGPSLFALAGIPAAAQTAPSGYNPGETLQVTYTLDTAGASLLALGWAPELPAGWVIENVSGDAAPMFARNEIICGAAVLPTVTATVTVTVRVPLTETRTVTLGGAARLITDSGYGVESYAMESVTLAPVDGDSNGMADAWERTFAGAAGSLDPAADLDGDTMSNLNEYRCGTLPNDAASVLKMVAVRPLADGKMQVSWASVAGRTYAVQRAVGSPAAANFMTILAGIAADPTGRNVYVDDADGAQARFYRVVLQD